MEWTSIVSVTVATLALSVSALTAWLTLLRQGSVMMTQPTLFFFGTDAGGPQDGTGRKVYLRTLLYTTSRRGRVVETMYVRLKRNETSQNFNVWAFGPRSELERGSGLFVPESGIAANHHFLLPVDGSSYSFLAGRYVIEVYASLAGERSPRLLYTTTLELTPELARSLEIPEQGVYFDWGPDSGRYHAHIRPRPQPSLSNILSEFQARSDKPASAA